jgi:mRNA interferase RelE/StbE
MRYSVEFKPSARKALGKLPDAARRRIIHAIEGLGDDPRPPGCVKLSGEDGFWRIRVGDYRVVYQIADRILLVLVLRVADRKDVYR